VLGHWFGPYSRRTRHHLRVGRSRAHHRCPGSPWHPRTRSRRGLRHRWRRSPDGPGSCRSRFWFLTSRGLAEESAGGGEHRLPGPGVDPVAGRQENPVSRSASSRAAATVSRSGSPSAPRAKQLRSKLGSWVPVARSACLPVLLRVGGSDPGPSTRPGTLATFGI